MWARRGRLAYCIAARTLRLDAQLTRTRWRAGGAGRWTILWHPSPTPDPAVTRHRLTLGPVPTSTSRNIPQFSTVLVQIFQHSFTHTKQHAGCEGDHCTDGAHFSAGMTKGTYLRANTENPRNARTHACYRSDMWAK